MIKSLALKFGSNDGPPLAFAPGVVTVFVGPNNSGKSLVLRELWQHINSEPPPPGKILRSVSFRELSQSETDVEIARLKQPPRSDETVQPGQIVIAHGVHRNQTSENGLRSALLNPESNRGFFIRSYLQYQAITLDGTSRLNLANSSASRNLSTPPGSPLDLLLRDNTRRADLRKIVHEAFDRHLVIDTTEPALIKLKFADREPHEDEERSYKEVAVAFHSKTEPLEQFSDGVKAFVGTLVQVIAGEPKILTMDEPEAFLHPSLAFTIGKEICRILSSSNRQLFVSTHSPDFVMGCVASGVSVSIVRLTHSRDVSTARLLPHHELKSLMRKPMLRSTGALRGLFYQSVVVTEADADRAFYSEINERLLTFKPAWGAANTLFVNANGKDTISDIVTPLRALGIPTAAIVDLDVVEQGGTNWAKFMDASNVPPLDRAALEISRSKIRAALVAADKDYKRKGGIGVLSAADQEAAMNFISRLADYGLFVVSRGEVEHWLTNISLNRSKVTWLREVFAKIGEQSDQPDYIKPGEDDVWKFISDVRGWLVDAKRKGIPS